ncbi:hypothetical protein ST201phi2-1p436 [Pseudomonas phage 201phi2-1]|uniref:Uncharacterized protein n=1 Tax=Pseudomonas phage 201phi2-1 TaxID=198110 RepID=B3FJU4_BP201|nr:hypothetical protein ST201phi2-1p436 [Pseudomonas phage 201phi2-1]ABY63259.1 hypothetical protein 201phi2-1p436 [Pseudomonas phage 201phi2-1]
MNDYVKPLVDYVSIIDALEKVTRYNWERWGNTQHRGDPAWVVRDCKTIGLYVGRQCGLSQGALKWIAKHPNKCILITKDSYLKLALANDYLKNTGRERVDYTQLVPSASGTIEKWNAQLSDEEKLNTRYVIVDDAQFTVGAGYVKRAEFNKWVAETFHPDTFVILIK